MKTNFGTSLSIGPLFVIVTTSLLFAPLVASAQTNTATGTGTLYYDTTGEHNSAFGYYALYQNTTGSDNTAIGLNALYLNVSGNRNSATGSFALRSNTTGSGNAAFGYSTLYSNTAGDYNTGGGTFALFSSTTGSYNTAYGYNALYSNDTGDYNTATGLNTLGLNVSGAANTATGNNALYSLDSGDWNTATGGLALAQNTAGSYNTSTGGYSLYQAIGSNNIAVGYRAGVNLKGGSNNIYVGNEGIDVDQNVIRIGTTGTHYVTYIAGINGVTNDGGTAVYIDASGQLGTYTSSRRFKKDIKTIGSVSDKLMQLRPVTFRYKQAAKDGSYPLQYGLIAEEVAKVYPDLVQYDKQGKPFTVYYHLLTPMLLSELQKEHRRNVEQSAKLAALTVTHRAEMATLNSKLDALAVAHNSDKAEIAALKQSQHEMMAKLAAFIQATQNRETVQKAAYLQR